MYLQQWKFYYLFLYYAISMQSYFLYYVSSIAIFIFKKQKNKTQNTK